MLTLPVTTYSKKEAAEKRQVTDLILDYINPMNQTGE